MRPLPLIRAVTLATMAVCYAVASAQSRDENWELCTNLHNDPDLRIGACTAIIQSGREATDDLAAAFNNRCAGHNDNRDYGLAIDDCDQAIKLQPRNAVAFNNRGLAYYGNGQYDRAIQDYDQAVSINSDYAAAFNNRGNAYRDKGQYDRAIQDYDQATSLDPQYAHAFNNRGLAYYAKGQYDRAIQNYDQAISLDPKYAHAFNNRGGAYSDKGQYDRAIEDYDQAISLDPKYAHAFNNRGYANFDTARFEAAANDFEQTLTIIGIRPYIVLWLHLARIRGHQEDMEEFSRNTARLDLTTWPGPVISFYLRHASAHEVTEAAKNGDEKAQREQSCEASFFLGEDALLRKQVSEAKTLLRQAHETCPNRFVQFDAAAEELKRIDR
jgi:lipoprotein NlpI